jgi:hypothetical protein
MFTIRDVLAVAFFTAATVALVAWLFVGASRLGRYQIASSAPGLVIMVDTATGEIRALSVGSGGGMHNSQAGQWKVIELTPPKQAR